MRCAEPGVEGRAGQLQKTGILTYDKFLYDLLTRGDMSALRWYVLCAGQRRQALLITAFISRKITTSLPHWTPFSTHRALAATLITLSLGGHTLVPLNRSRVFNVLRRPHGDEVHGRGIYQFRYITDGEGDYAVLPAYQEILSLMARPIFRETEPRSAKLLLRRNRIWAAFSRRFIIMRKRATRLLVNFAEERQRAEMDLDKVFDYYPQAPRGIQDADPDRMEAHRSEGARIHRNAQRLTIDLPANGYAIIVFHHVSSPVEDNDDMSDFDLLVGHAGDNPWVIYAQQKDPLVFPSGDPVIDRTAGKRIHMGS